MSIQFISFGSSTTPPSLAGRTLIASDGNTDHAFTFPNDSIRLGSIASDYSSLFGPELGRTAMRTGP